VSVAGWESTALSQVTTRIGSGSTPRGGASVYRNAGRPFVRSQNVVWGALHLADLAHIDEATHRSMLGSEISAGDVLLNITGASIGRAAVATSQVAGGNVNQHVCEIRLDRSVMDPTFVCACLLSEFGQKQIGMFQAGGNREGLNFQQVGALVVPKPTLVEQLRIAEILADADRYEASLQAVVSKKEDMLRGLLQQLLTGKSRLLYFDEPWERRRLGDHVSYLRTVALSRAELDTTSPTRCLHYGNIHTKLSPYLDAAAETLPRAAHHKVQTAGRLAVGDVVFADASEDPAGVGKSVEVTAVPAGGVVAGLHTIAARFDETVLAHGFGAYLQFHPDFRAALLRLAAGTKVLATSRSYISSVELELPSVDEQRAIADVLRDATAEIDALRARVAKARAIRQGLMQQLLTGRTRIPTEVPEELAA
jgi:type I restriction enzyme S subunit